MFCGKKDNKDFSFNARELVIKAGSGKTWKREELILKDQKNTINGKIYLFILLFELKADKHNYQCPNIY